MIALVTGGGGFLGRAIVDRLVARGDRVRSLSRGDYPELRAFGVETISGDLADAASVDRAVLGVDAVIHVAARAGVWGPWDDYHQANVVGTRNVVEACRRHGVGRLVFTSSPSVVSTGSDIEGGDESLPYPAHHAAPYPATKAEAERIVLGANGPTLATVALRPHLIWGPGDNHLVPRIVARGRAGRLRRIGTRPNRVDSTFIDDAAIAHLQALDRLAPGSAVAGRAYFISGGDPWPVWDLINGILRAAGVAPVTRSVPPRVAHLLGWGCEVAYRALGRPDEPPMTRFVAHQLSTAHWFDITAARRDLGYRPAVTIPEGLERLEAWFRSTGVRA